MQAAEERDRAVQSHLSREQAAVDRLQQVLTRMERDKASLLQQLQVGSILVLTSSSAGHTVLCAGSGAPQARERGVAARS